MEQGRGNGMGQRIRVRSAGLTEKGRREANEDFILVDDTNRLYVVADGMGGARAGDVASRMAVDTVAQSMTARPEEAPTMAFDPSLSPQANRLLQSIRDANRKVFQSAQNHATQKGMGSTVAAVMITDATLVAANVGDSPIYRFRQGIVEPLWVKHSLEGRQERGREPERELSESERHTLTRALGAAETVRVDIFETPVFHGDRILLCSDGVSDMVSPEEMRDTVLGNAPEKACAYLVGQAMERGGRDNVTAVVVHCSKPRRLLTAPLRAMGGALARLAGR